MVGIVAESGVEWARVVRASVCELAQEAIAWPRAPGIMRFVSALTMS